MTGAGDLSSLPDDRLLARMARHLQARIEHPVGSVLWAYAVQGCVDCQAELDRRLMAHIREAVRKLGRPDVDP